MAKQGPLEKNGLALADIGAADKAAMHLDQDSLTACFGRVWPVHTDAFCELLVTLRQHFGGDLDRMLVLAVIGSRTLARGRTDGLCYDHFMDAERAGEPASTNLQSIADYSGIPRETVRRKLRDLEESGWISRSEKGHFVATAEAAKDLEPATKATMRYLLAVVTAWQEAVSDQTN